MRKLSFFLLVLILIAPVVQADTIHLKNGSVLKGKVTSFADDQFIVMLDTGSGRYLSRAMVYIGDVARIEFDAPAGVASVSEPREAPREPSPTVSEPTRTSSEPPRTMASRDTQPRNTQPAEPQPRDVTPTDTQPREVEKAREPEPKAESKPEPAQPERPAVSADKPSVIVPTSDSPEPERPMTRKPVAPGRTATIDVVAKRDWTSTGLIIKRGDRVRINASGTVTLDPVTGRTTGPEGISDLTDTNKLMRDQPTGALIGVIGADNDDFIFIGRSAEFTATRDGLLFLSVNEGSLADNTGTFKAVIEVFSQRR
ncbi:MAG TPA: hypothetical protein VNN73_03615 [Blastocatellia bacterium]|nr:hypothetical protein [Blastocatellia bacterium]